eukprot:COSAG05_NODE_1585_length_4485_cov_2.704514_3_plen_52_part_00
MMTGSCKQITHTSDSNSTDGGRQQESPESRYEETMSDIRDTEAEVSVWGCV